MMGDKNLTSAELRALIRAIDRRVNDMQYSMEQGYSTGWEPEIELLMAARYKLYEQHEHLVIAEKSRWSVMN